MSDLTVRFLLLLAQPVSSLELAHQVCHPLLKHLKAAQARRADDGKCEPTHYPKDRDTPITTAQQPESFRPCAKAARDDM